MKFATATWFVSLIDLGPEIGWIIGPVIMSGLMTTMSKDGLFDFMNSHAAASDRTLDTLYPRTGSFASMACSAVTYRL